MFFHLPRHTFITTWKARFNFRILGLLRILCQNLEALVEEASDPYPLAHPPSHLTLAPPSSVRASCTYWMPCALCLSPLHTLHLHSAAPWPSLDLRSMPLGAMVSSQEDKSVKRLRAIWEENSGVLHTEHGGMGGVHPVLWIGTFCP